MQSTTVNLNIQRFNERAGVWDENPVRAELAHIPVVAISANAMPRDIAKGMAMGFYRYLTKPIKVKEFMDTLNEALEHAEKGKEGSHAISFGTGELEPDK